MKARPNQSQFFRGILKVRDVFYKFSSKKIGNGQRTRFWEDFWLGSIPFYKKFARLYNLTSSENILVSTFFMRALVVFGLEDS